jgi:hypothetical protein
MPTSTKSLLAVVRAILIERACVCCRLIDRLESWLKISEQYNDTHPLSPTTPTTFREVHGESKFMILIFKNKNSCASTIYFKK